MEYMVYKVTKSYRNGTVVSHFILMRDYELDDPEVWAQERAENWGRTDLAGQNYGYSLEWELETDRAVIKRIVSEEIVKLDKQLKSTIDQMDKLESILKAEEEYEEHVADIAINLQKDENNQGPE